MRSLFAKLAERKAPDAPDTDAQVEKREKDAKELEQALLQLHKEAGDQIIDLTGTTRPEAVKKEAKMMLQSLETRFEGWQARKTDMVRADKKLRSVLACSATLAVKQQELDHCCKVYSPLMIKTGVPPWWAESAHQHRQSSPVSAVQPPRTPIGPNGGGTLAPDTLQTATQESQAASVGSNGNATESTFGVDQAKSSSKSARTSFGEIRSKKCSVM
ncbi:hypothetical protein QFC20_006620 [Naganishia adeliensis]|uniref:Uncharacterized protein n=1 Tax=Naganishia adeliensis TaxID=92952 RepID=A0ACC2V883_9TREE|nr:hypothetical protein QFC20_006620 [Naganishia adeliensis]